MFVVAAEKSQSTIDQLVHAVREQYPSIDPQRLREVLEEELSVCLRCTNVTIEQTMKRLDKRISRLLS